MKSMFDTAVLVAVSYFGAQTLTHSRRLVNALSFSSGGQKFFRDSQHQFYSVQLIDFGAARIAVNRNDIRPLVGLSQVVHNALARDVIRQARERLKTDDIFDALFNQFDHLARQEPALARQIARAHEAACKFCGLFNRVRGAEVFGIF